MPGAYIPFIIATTTSPQVPPTSPLTSPGVFSLILLLLWRPDTTISWSDGRTQLTHVFVQGMEKRGAQGSANSKKNHATLEPPFVAISLCTYLQTPQFFPIRTFATLSPFSSNNFTPSAKLPRAFLWARFCCCSESCSLYSGAPLSGEWTHGRTRI